MLTNLSYRFREINKKIITNILRKTYFLGYNDVSWHNPDIQTPWIDKLISTGVILESHYVQQMCTPTRYVSVRMNFLGLMSIHISRWFYRFIYSFIFTYLELP